MFHLTPQGVIWIANSEMGHIGDGGKHHRHDNASVFCSNPLAAGTATAVIVGIIVIKHVALAMIVGSPLAALLQSLKPKIRAQCPFAKWRSIFAALAKWPNSHPLQFLISGLNSSFAACFGDAVVRRWCRVRARVDWPAPPGVTVHLFVDAPNWSALIQHHVIVITPMTAPAHELAWPFIVRRVSITATLQAKGAYRPARYAYLARLNLHSSRPMLAAWPRSSHDGDEG
jgi:hypothetical protein